MEISITLDNHLNFDVAFNLAIEKYKDSRPETEEVYSTDLYDVAFAFRGVTVRDTSYDGKEYTYNFNVKESP